jgi:hypothetical protein
LAKKANKNRNGKATVSKKPLEPNPKTDNLLKKLICMSDKWIKKSAKRLKFAES